MFNGLNVESSNQLVYLDDGDTFEYISNFWGLLHVNFPRVNPFLLKIVFVHIPIAGPSLFGSTFLIHRQNLADNTFFA